MKDIAKQKDHSFMTAYLYRSLTVVVLLISSISLVTVFSSHIAHAASPTSPSRANPTMATLANAIDMHRIFSRPVINTAPTPPPYTTARYIQPTDMSGTTNLDSDGCSQGQANIIGVVILDFGQPWIKGSSYGAYLPGTTYLVDLFDIKSAVETYLNGFWRCAGQGSFVVLAIGTSNCGNGPPPPSNPKSLCNPGANVTSAHGHAWATLVNAVDSWIISQGFDSKEIAAGASDMELEWNSKENTRSWADGYSSNAQYHYLDYGDAVGCPENEATTADRPCGYNWNQSDVVYVSWDNFAALPFPEIYNTHGHQAKQWQGLSYYSRNHPNSQRGGMYILGSLTQHAACQIVTCDPTVDNTPQEGWTQLYNALNDPNSPQTAQALPYSSDITWDK